MSASKIPVELSKQAHSIAQKATRLLADLNPAPTLLEQTRKRNFQLAHYTSLEALISMLRGQNGGLRLSHSSMMNDPDEGRTTTDGRFIMHLLNEEFEADSWTRSRYDYAHIGCFVGVVKGPESVIAGDDLLFWRLYGYECHGLSITLATDRSTELVYGGDVHRVLYSRNPPLGIDLRPIAVILRELENLRHRALELGLWESIFPLVLPQCDRLMAHRFLHKHVNYSMEREYRAVEFVTGKNNASEDKKYLALGNHLQLQHVRSFVQTSQLSLENILNTNCEITIGSNLPQNERIREFVAELIEDTLGYAPNVVKIYVSTKRFRSR